MVEADKPVAAVEPTGGPRRVKHPYGRTLLLSVGLALPGCMSLEAVRDASIKLTAASDSWRDVGDEFAASCARERLLNPTLVDCALERRASEGVAGATTILQTYFTALADAADEANFDVQPGLDDATASVANVPGINADRVKAASGLVSLLLRFANQALRERTLRELIGTGGPAAQSLIRGIDEIVGTALAGRLGTERTQLTGQFGRLILAQRDPVGPDPAALCTGPAAARFSGTGFLLAIEYCRRAAVLDERTAALRTFRESLGTADKLLADLQSSRSKLKTKDLARRLHAMVRDLDEQLAAVRKAFGGDRA